MEADEMANMKLLGEIYRKYVETYTNRAMDFDDLLLRNNELLTRFPGSPCKISGQIPLHFW